MTFTDEELDRDWVPNGRRPQSTIARNFQQELGELFKLDAPLTDLNTKIDERKQNLGKNNQELADLEARLREMEQRLTTVGYTPPRPSNSPNKNLPTTSPGQGRAQHEQPNRLPAQATCPPPPGPVKVNTISSREPTWTTNPADFWLLYQDGDGE
ncbi:hypothetical protein PT974_02614 [Cladobotryum mycophilum]|uniref:Uncharacterized protein n=1 Tax=Cladobotryum mycophilum TaxID=491253 RepID=A0ABR0SZS9_9HYPO